MIFLPDCRHEPDWKAEASNERFEVGNVRVDMFEVVVTCGKCHLTGAVLDGRDLTTVIKFLTRDSWECRQDFFNNPDSKCVPTLHEENVLSGHEKCGWRNANN